MKEAIKETIKGAFVFSVAGMKLVYNFFKKGIKIIIMIIVAIVALFIGKKVAKQ